MSHFLCITLFEDLVNGACTYIHTVLHKLCNNRQNFLNLHMILEKNKIKLNGTLRQKRK